MSRSGGVAEWSKATVLKSAWAAYLTPTGRLLTWAMDRHLLGKPRAVLSSVRSRSGTEPHPRQVRLARE